jgi:predicted small lipoprotein YifL
MRLRAILLFIVALALTACGKRGPLLYPDMLVPAPPTGVTARQTGQVMRISFTPTRKDRAGRELDDLAGVTLFRRAALAGQEAGCNACTEGYSIIRKLYLEAPLENGVQRSGSRMLLLDSDVKVGETYSYTVEPFTAGGVVGQASPPVTVRMVAPPPAPRLSAVADPIQIELNITPVSVGQGMFEGYNLYRAVQGEPLPFLPLNREPIKGTSYVDSALEGLDRTRSYVYAVRTVARMPDGALVESELSNQLQMKVTEE